METDWGTAIVVDPRALQRLEAAVTTLRRSRQQLRFALVAGVGCSVLAALTAWVQTTRLETVTVDARTCHRHEDRATESLAVLARSHRRILSATEHVPALGSGSWGRRFVVTKYLPRDPRYGRFNHGITATLTKADPDARIVAVDPKVIPYGSWVWVEDLGWFRAEDCGSAIKGFRLDLLTARLDDAMQFGKQERFVMVVPPSA